MDHGKIWGLSRTYNTDYEYMLTPAGGKVVYGYPCPSNPHIIQGYAVPYSQFSPEPYDEDLEAAKAQKGILMTLDCEGYGKSIGEALTMAESWRNREQSKLMIEEIVVELHPDYVQQIAPAEYIKVKKINEEENYDARNSLISADASKKLSQKMDQFLYKLLDEINPAPIGSMIVNQAYERLLKEQKRTTTRELLFDHLYTPKIQQAIFGKLVQTTKLAWEKYSQFERGPIENRKEEIRAYHAYKNTQDTLLRAESEFKDAVISRAVKSNESLRDCIVMLGAEKMFFNQKNDKSYTSKTIQKLQKNREILQDELNSNKTSEQIKERPRRRVTVMRKPENTQSRGMER